ncbi:hypothetical protein CTI12_AA237830 [Artemisia annua]|uniref:Uncharacterized protein n=1 Tax=Artemisia annua TaxID=35608 RepID=A0A2U1NQZ9_ARTAN|nr:hypothetical protein CTI12_AA237830 [Artemisia annua]
MNGDEFVEQEESSTLDSQKIESSEWTNEKHNSYLKSIEASFIDQLYNSLSTRSCQTQNTSSSDAISAWKNHTNDCTPSGQFKVLQGGHWSKKSFNRENLQGKDADRPHLSRGNRWIQHFTTGSSCPQKRSSSSVTLPQYPVPESQLLEQTGCSDAEVTDQNFVEDTSRRRKRTRTSIVVNSSNDQVVPFCTSDATDIRDGYGSPKNIPQVTRLSGVMVMNIGTSAVGNMGSSAFIHSPQRTNSVRINNFDQELHFFKLCYTCIKTVVTSLSNEENVVTLFQGSTEVADYHFQHLKKVKA